MKDVNQAVEFFVSLGETKDIQENIRRVYEGPVGFVIISKIKDVNALPDIQRLFNDNGINYMKESGMPEGKLFTFEKELGDPERMAALQATYSYENNQTMSR